MGKTKAEKGTPKWLANKMKSKGLQKLRWYCQMCQKQCRDANGFKCHITSESHQRQLLLFGENPGKFLYEFSKEFERDFTDIIRRCHGTKRVFANTVYQEYIRDKNHVHMNATRWVTLNGFVRYLGASGKAKIDETEKGFYITWIDRDPETIARQKALAKKEKMVKDDQERMAEFVNKQVERQKDKLAENLESSDNFTELKREKDKIELGLKIEKKESNVQILEHKPLKIHGGEKKRKVSSERKKTAFEELVEEETKEKERKKLKQRERNETPWLKSNIVVKIKTKSLGEKFYKQKGQIIQVIDKFSALVKLSNEDQTQVKLDQNDCETVIPAVGRKVLVLMGKYRGEKAELISLNVEDFSANLSLLDFDKKLTLPYEEFSKLAN